jgi:hypothetical protein
MDPIVSAKLAELGIGAAGAGLQAILQKRESDYNDKFKSKKKLEEFLAAEELKKLDKQYSKHTRKELEKKAKEEYAKSLKQLKEKYKGQSHRKSKTNYNNEKQVFKDIRDKQLADLKNNYQSKQGEYHTKEQAIRDKLKNTLHNLQREELEYRTTGKSPEWFGSMGGAGLGGAAEGIGTYSTLTPEQQEASREILKRGLEGLGKYSPDFAPTAQKYRNEFAQQIVPGLAERFSALGAGSQKSSAFQQALGQAGAGLSENLAAAEQGYNQQALEHYKNLLNQGLRPQIESFYKPGDVGAQGSKYAGVGEAFRNIGGGVGNILQYLGQKSANQQQQQQQQAQPNAQTNGTQVPATPEFNPPAEMSYLDIYRKNNPMLQF